MRRIASVPAHQGFYVGDALRCFNGNELAAVPGYEHVVLDAHTDVPISLGHVRGGTDIAAGLYRERHARGERPPLAVVLVFSGVVHVQPQPVSGACLLYTSDAADE